MSKVIFCVPTIERPFPQFLDAMELSIQPVIDAGWEQGIVSEVGNPYISNARNAMLRKALDANADVIVFLDHDISWGEQDLLRLIETKAEVAAGTYRFKKDSEEYMGQVFSGADGTPLVREDGCIKAELVPAGFLKITAKAVDIFAKKYPELLYGTAYRPHIDLFNHGAINGLWYGEDYAFSKRWRATRNELWIVPDLNLTHWKDGKPYAGNFHEFLKRQPGGVNDPALATDAA